MLVFDFFDIKSSMSFVDGESGNKIENLSMRKIQINTMQSAHVFATQH